MAKLKLQFLLLNHILKWKDCQLDPLGHCFRSSLRGIKDFTSFSLGELRDDDTYIVASCPRLHTALRYILIVRLKFF